MGYLKSYSIALIDNIWDVICIWKSLQTLKISVIHKTEQESLPLISWVGCKPCIDLTQVFSSKANLSNKVLAKTNFLFPYYHHQKLEKHFVYHSNQKFCLFLTFAHENVISLLSFGCCWYFQHVPGKSHKILSQVTWQSSGRENCFSAILYCFKLQMSLYLLQVFVSFCFVFNPAVALSVLESKIYISLTV